MRQIKFRINPDFEEKVNRIFQRYGITGDGDTELWRALIDKLDKEPILDKNSTPVSDSKSSIEHLNIDDKNGAIQTYMNKREARLELRKERVEEAYLKERARQRAKAEGEEERAEIKDRYENKKRFAKQYIRSGKPKVDWGNSEGVEPNYSQDG